MRDMLRSIRLSLRQQIDALGGIGRGGGTRKLAEARAAQSGHKVESEMRSIQRELKTGKAPAKMTSSVRDAGGRRAAAAQLRGARRISGGTVRVIYIRNGRRVSEGTRTLGTYDVSDGLASAVNRAADALESGDSDTAHEILSEALLDEYGGLGGTLEIDDFTSGINFS